jgi:hypothetical protein
MNVNKKALYTQAQKSAFIGIMLEHSRISGSEQITTSSWNNIVKKYNKEQGTNFDKTQLQSLQSSLKKQYMAHKETRAKSGFGYDVARQVATADDEVFEEYIQNDEEKANIRTDKMVNFEELSELFDKKTASGSFASAIGIGDATPISSSVTTESSSSKAVATPMKQETTGSCSSTKKKRSRDDVELQQFLVALKETFAPPPVPQPLPQIQSESKETKPRLHDVYSLIDLQKGSWKLTAMESAKLKTIAMSWNDDAIFLFLSMSEEERAEYIKLILPN